MAGEVRSALNDDVDERWARFRATVAAGETEGEEVVVVVVVVVGDGRDGKEDDDDD